MSQLLLESLTALSDASSLMRSLEFGLEHNGAMDLVEKKVKGTAPKMTSPTDLIKSSNHQPEHECAPRNDQRHASSCPGGFGIYKTAQEEFDLIRSAHRTLATNGCTNEFCQSGRATKLLEPRVGRDRPLSEVSREAEEFLKACRDVGIIETDDILDRRIESALGQVRGSSAQITVVDQYGRESLENAGGTWRHTTAELEYGLRLAWKNSKRCIMRSEHESLALCDLRHVISSRDMAYELIENVNNAFAGGRIRPTVFVFPARLPGRRGPMLWNEQLLAFAGYQERDGSMLGDPKNVELTNAMIEFGWQPPMPKSRWDVLPIVVMADEDEPYLIELPTQLRRLVRITHPSFEDEFAKLDLKWVLLPALSRLGFDIGGVQYTAAPFVGWFMDAEIGVRNLADKSRYNVLPDIVEALKLSDRPETPFEDLPEYLRLAALSRAQAELNLAVYHSYEREKVMMIDTMTASLNYMQFDDKHKAETGFRLPADPYWLAPPQGSIIPIWHRGAAPNYQPKPMIARHVQDPIKAWKRSYPEMAVKSAQSYRSVQKCTMAKRRVRIFNCSDGITAGKLTTRIYEKLEKLSRWDHERFEVQSPQPLNSLMIAECEKDDVVLIIASTTGCGEVPRNAKRFMRDLGIFGRLASPPVFSIYGNGDSTHGDSYNAAPKMLHKHMSSLGCHDLLGGIFDGDTAFHNPDWESFNFWTQQIEAILSGSTHTDNLARFQRSFKAKEVPGEIMTATLVNKEQQSDGGLVLVTFDIGHSRYAEADHFKFLAPNKQADVVFAMEVLGIQATERSDLQSCDMAMFLETFVDLSLNFKTLDWYQYIATIPPVEKADLLTKSVCTVLRTLRTVPNIRLRQQILRDMPCVQPRHFSAASSPFFGGSGRGLTSYLDILVKFNPSGRFSDSWLANAQVGQKIRFCHVRSDFQTIVHNQPLNAPLILIATGSGMGPVRSILQLRLKNSQPANSAISIEKAILTGTSLRDNGTSLHEDQVEVIGTSDSSANSTPRSQPCSRASSESSINLVSRDKLGSPRYLNGSIFLFAGFTTKDQPMIEKIVQPAKDAGLFACLELCPSNPEKERVQDRLLLPAVSGRLAHCLRDPACVTYICANASAAEATLHNLAQILGEDIKQVMGGRLVEEIFRG